MPTPIRKRRFGSNNTKKRSRKKNSRKKNSRKKSSRKRSRGRSRGNADGVNIGTTTGELVNQHQQQSVLGKRKVPLSFPPGAPDRERKPPSLDEVDDVRGRQHGSMMGKQYTVQQERMRDALRIIEQENEKIKSAEAKKNLEERRRRSPRKKWPPTKGPASRRWEHRPGYEAGVDKLRKSLRLGPSRNIQKKSSGKHK